MFAYLLRTPHYQYSRYIQYFQKAKVFGLILLLGMLYSPNLASSLPIYFLKFYIQIIFSNVILSQQMLYQFYIIMQRSATSQSCRTIIKTPIPIQQIENRKRALLTRQRISSGFKPELGFKETSTPFRQTGATFNRPNIFARIRSSSEFKSSNGFISQHVHQNLENTPSEMSKGRNSIPLKLLNISRQSDEQQSVNKNNGYSQDIRKRQFLRKGTAINKAIMFNVLKSKCNKNICDSAYSYSNNKKNDVLKGAIYDQVPRGLRDVIGPEQMLRMSNIFTGGTIDAINLHRKVNEVISGYKINKVQNLEQQQGLTLKSIKRW